MIGKTLAIAMGLVCGALLSQGPEFVQQYSQRLGGRLDELRGFVERFDRDAAAAGLNRLSALAEYQENSSNFVSARGRDAADTILRFERYEAHRNALREAAPFSRLWVFARDADGEIAAATAEDYQPAVPVTLEGLAHAGAGFGIGALITGLFARMLRKRRERKIIITG
ncbi:hypothetical protein GCM10007276_32870 [Agaricicola taiwanensis]|uniref:DUF2937 family protein n=1 Tax=Agaricicola taiwanensis TaxID=591372 RepID=A0A8J2YMB6_9RHOB|nr:DUF2937 family protein [Agaricicola taiwanensis]GGE53254.1 hypothetical protein GCM10007276_32870 [Agaricicola taiwanensis]